MRLIDAEYMTPSMYPFLDPFALLSVKKWIDEQPTVDAEAVRHAHWVEHRDCVCVEDDEYLKTTYSCSLCGRIERIKEPYCNCGAKMDGDEHE